jgi:hypothetical protein
VDLAAVLDHFAFELLQIKIKVRQSMFFDLASRRADRLELGQRVDGGPAFTDEPVFGMLSDDVIESLAFGNRLIVRHTCQHLGDVQNLGGLAQPAQASGNIHQTTQITAEQDVSTAVLKRVDLVTDHALRQFRIFHTKGAAETATHFAILHFKHVETLDLAQQGSRLLFNTKFTQTGTGIMVGHALRELRFNPHLINYASEKTQ